MLIEIRNEWIEFGYVDGQLDKNTLIHMHTHTHTHTHRKYTTIRYNFNIFQDKLYIFIFSIFIVWNVRYLRRSY